MNPFIKGSIPADFISEKIAAHSSKTDIGAHTFFLGQVRKDEVTGKQVDAIVFYAYESMAEKEIATIREEILSRYSLKCMHIWHSIGRVSSGEICFFVLVSSAHRKSCFEALEETVSLVKERVPIWKQLILDDGSKVWADDEQATESILRRNI